LSMSLLYGVLTAFFTDDNNPSEEGLVPCGVSEP